LKVDRIMTDHDIPAALVTHVRASLSAVRPLASPARRLLALLPLAAVLLLGPPLCYAWRDNLALLPGWASWGLSIFESLAGAALLGLALRQAVPGLAVRSRWMLLAFAGAVAVFAAVSLITARVLPTPLHEPGAWSRLAWECVVMELVFAVPALVVTAWLVARALPTRPALTGVAYGLAVGLMTDAGLRLFCSIDAPSHVFAGHGGAILLGAAGSAVVAATVERIKYRRLR
jgi:hypothetical protein